jgi:hypothetical protein
MKRFGLSILPALLFGASMAIGAATQASATIYTYTGNADPSTGNYITGSVDLNCAGSCAAGNYVYNSGISSFSFTDNTSANVPVFTISSSTPGVAFYGWVEFLSLNNAGQVTDWFFFAEIAALSKGILTTGPNWCGPGCAVDQFYDHGRTSVEISNHPGTWQVAAVPEPSTWAMMILGFAGVGFIAYRRRKVAAFAG